MGLANTNNTKELLLKNFGEVRSIFENRQKDEALGAATILRDMHTGMVAPQDPPSFQFTHSFSSLDTLEKFVSKENLVALQAHIKTIKENTKTIDAGRFAKTIKCEGPGVKEAIAAILLLTSEGISEEIKKCIK